MAARIVEYKPAAVRPFDDVKDEIRRQLVRQAAAELAQKAGREKLALLEQGKSDKDAGVTFAKPVTLVRNQPQPGFTPEAITRIFQADAAKLPRYVGAAERARRILDLPAREGDRCRRQPMPAKLAAARARIGEMQNREVFDAYVAR